MSNSKSAKSTGRKIGEVMLEKIDIPENARRAARSPFTAAIREMKPGESFTVPAESVKSVRSTLAKEKRTRKDFDYLTHKLDSGEIRVWRQ